MPNPENILPFKFAKGVSGNPNGQPVKKVTSAISKALEKLGVEKATNGDIEEVFRRMLNLNESQIRAFANDKESPILVSVTARLILDTPEHIERLIDRVAGKARQSIVTEDSSGEIMPITLQIIAAPLQPDNE